MSKHHIVPIKLYLFIITALFVLTMATVEVAKQDFGAMNNVIALGIAAVKMLLVVLFFMHLKYSAKILWLCAGAGLVWLVIMMTIMLSDYESRTWIGVPQAWEKPPVVQAAASHEVHHQ